MATVGGVTLTKSPIGRPTGLNPGAVMPLNGTVVYGAVLSILSLTSLGNYTVAATCSSPHGLSNNRQVAVEGILFGQASGFYSVTVTSTLSFTYQILSVLPIESLLTSTTRVTTVLAGLPYDYTQIPAVAPVNNSDVYAPPVYPVVHTGYSLNFSKAANTLYGGIIAF